MPDLRRPRKSLKLDYKAISRLLWKGLSKPWLDKQKDAEVKDKFSKLFGESDPTKGHLDVVGYSYLGKFKTRNCLNSGHSDDEMQYNKNRYYFYKKYNEMEMKENMKEMEGSFAVGDRVEGLYCEATVGPEHCIHEHCWYGATITAIEPDTVPNSWRLNWDDRSKGGTSEVRHWNAIGDLLLCTGKKTCGKSADTRTFFIRTKLQIYKGTTVTEKMHGKNQWLLVKPRSDYRHQIELRKGNKWINTDSGWIKSTRDFPHLLKYFQSMFDCPRQPDCPPSYDIVPVPGPNLSVIDPPTSATVPVQVPVLPPGWESAVDPESGNTVYWETSNLSATATWTHPSDASSATVPGLRPAESYKIYTWDQFKETSSQTLVI